MNNLQRQFDFKSATVILSTDSKSINQSINQSKVTCNARNVVHISIEILYQPNNTISQTSWIIRVVSKKESGDITVHPKAS